MSRNETGLKGALRDVEALQEEFTTNVNIAGKSEDINQALERGLRLMDFLEIGHLMCRDALERDESCGCHFREEHQSEDGEVLRNDDNFGHVSVWEWEGEEGEGKEETRHQEKLDYEVLQPATRSYK